MKRKIEISLLAWFVFFGVVSGSFAARHTPEPGWRHLVSGLITSTAIGAVIG